MADTSNVNVAAVDRSFTGSGSVAIESVGGLPESVNNNLSGLGVGRCNNSNRGGVGDDDNVAWNNFETYSDSFFSSYYCYKRALD